MKALFLAEFNEVVAAISRAGLSQARTNSDEVASADVAVAPVREYVGSGALAVSVHGSTNAVMRLIGAMADDGQECLFRAE